jgi:hypothetical protein
MHRAGAYALSNDEDPKTTGKEASGDRYVHKYVTFDKYGTFEQRYARYRRYNDSRDASKYSGELDQELR